MARPPFLLSTVLVLLSVSAAGAGPTMSNSRSASVASDHGDHPSDRKALYDLAIATDYKSWVFNDKWLSPSSVCDWQLVGCNKQGEAIDNRRYTTHHHSPPHSRYIHTTQRCRSSEDLSFEFQQHDGHASGVYRW